MGDLAAVLGALLRDFDTQVLDIVTCLKGTWPYDAMRYVGSNVSF